MAKITKTKEGKAVHSQTVTTNQGFSWRAHDLIPLITALLYFAIHFVPDFGAYDAMGSQWLYMILVDMLVVIFILARKNQYDEATSKVFGNLFSRLYIAFFLLAGISIITAINPTESWVCYARLIATIVAFFNVSILLYKRNDLFKILSQLLALLLLVESCQAIAHFLKGIETTDMTTVILELKGTTGNKNIFAASTIVKIPFAIYCIQSSKLVGKILNAIILLLAALTIFLVNARASYVSLALITMLYIFYCLWNYRAEKKMEAMLSRLGYVLIPIIVALFISQVELSNVKSLQEQKGEGYGTVAERVATFTVTSNQVRIDLWRHALDYTSQHPWLGCGYGNWKIASIPYQRVITNDLFVPIHSHNDFVEQFAEMGIAGGLLYLAMFTCIVVFTTKTFFGKATEDTKLISLISFLAFIGYSVDAFFNFPMERPISQMFFVFITALNVSAYISGKEAVEYTSSENKPAKKAQAALFGVIALLLLIPATYIAYLTYQSLTVQKTVLNDLNNEPLKLDWKTTVASFPPMPNLTATAQPVDAIKGRYLYEAGKYEEALVLLDKGRIANPVIGYSEFLKAGLYFKTGKLDSAVRNATFAYYTRPKAKTYYQTLIAVLAKVKDTTGIKKAFAEFDRYRHEPIGWDLYLRGMLNAQGQGSKHLLLMADSAMKMFANQEGVAAIAKVREEIIRFMNVTAVNTTTANSINAETLAMANKYYNDGVATFGAGVFGKDDLEKAAGLFLKSASLNPGNYVAYENAAICYFNMKQWQKSITYFNKVLATKQSVNGKPEYFKGVALYNLGQKDAGCTNLKAALAKGWKDAETIINANCK